MLYRCIALPTSHALAAVLAAASLAAPTVAAAQGERASEAQAASGSGSDAHIVVTAQKREQRLVDVPLAVTVISDADLSHRLLHGVSDLADAVPSLTYTPGINSLISTLRIRGIGSLLFNQGLDSSVLYVTDGVPLARQSQGLQDLIDIERVEVLRGPQGTLFGKNATAGVINVVTQRPSDRFGFTGDVTIAEMAEYRLRASVTGPLSKDLSGRVTGFYNRVGGHIRNAANATRLNGERGGGVRAQLAYKPTQDLNFLLIGDYSRTTQNCCQWQAVRADTPLYASLLAPVIASRRNRAVNANADVFNDTTQWGLSLQADITTAAGTITSITALRDYALDANNDVDSVPTTQPLFGLPNNFGSFDINRSQSGLRQFSQELRLASSGENSLNYVLGLYFLNLEVDRELTRRIGLCLPTPANAGLKPGQTCRVPTFQSRLGVARVHNRNYAAFGQVDWTIADRLTLSGGLRLQRDEVTYRGSRAAGPSPDFPNDGILGATFIGGPAASSGFGKTGDTDLSGRAALQYRLGSDAQAYVSYTRGYKGPGFDIEPTTSFSAQAPVRPEKVDAFEAGFRGTFLDGALSLSAAAFHQDYRDLQVQVSVETGGLRAFIPANAGAATVRGVELEFAARPTRAFEISAGMTVLDTNVDIDGLVCVPGTTPAIIPAGNTPPGNTCFRFGNDAATANRQNVRNGRLPNAPRFRGVLSARYDDVIAPIGLRAFVQTSLIYQSRVGYALEQDPLMVQSGYTVVDASLGIGSPDRRYTLTLFARNLFNRNYASVFLRSPTWPSSTTGANINGFYPKQAERYFGANVKVAF